MSAVSLHIVHAATTKALIAGLPIGIVCAFGGVAPPGTAVRTADVIDTAEIVSSPTTIGIADSALYGMSQADIDKTLDTLQSIGVQDIRVFVPWAYVEPTQGTYNWSYLDEVMNAAAARNMGVMAEINATPAWDAASGTLPGAGAPNPTDFASFATQVATRYGSDISAYEIWNEPNYAGFYEPIDPAGYTALLKAAYPAIKAVDPTATVVAGALGSVVSFGGVTMDPTTFISDMYADGAKGYFDALSFHPYQESLEFSQGGSVPNSPLQQVTAIYNLMVANGDASKKIWISEYGLPTSDVTQQQQADYIQDILNTWKTESYGGPIFIYTAQDTNSASTNPQDTYGIYESDWTPKLAVAVIQQAIAADQAAAVTNPLAVFGQQLAAAFAAAVSQALPTLAQQLAQALAQAFAAAFAAPAATTASTVTPAVATATTAATVKTALVPSTVKPAVVTATTPTTPTTPKTPATSASTSTPSTPTVKALRWKAFEPKSADTSADATPPSSSSAPSSTAPSSTAPPKGTHPAPDHQRPDHPNADHTGDHGGDHGDGRIGAGPHG
jgi:polysaccharide biosynthesis protein PslG